MNFISSLSSQTFLLLPPSFLPGHLFLGDSAQMPPSLPTGVSVCQVSSQLTRVLPLNTAMWSSHLPASQLSQSEWYDDVIITAHICCAWAVLWFVWPCLPSLCHRAWGQVISSTLASPGLHNCFFVQCVSVSLPFSKRWPKIPSMVDALFPVAALSSPQFSSFVPIETKERCHTEYRDESPMF